MIDSDKLALINGTATIPYRITTVPNDGSTAVVLREDNITNTTYEDFRYVDTDSICIGQFVAREFDGTLVNINDSFTIENFEIKVEFGVKVGDNTNWYSLGNFLITKPDDNNVTDKTSFKSMDYAKKFNITFNPDYKDSTYTQSFKERIASKTETNALWLAQYVCTQCGVELATTNFTNYNFIIDSNQYDSDAQCRKVMQDIGKLAYSWVRIGWDNKCYIDFSVNSDTSAIDAYNKITNDNYYDLTLQNKNFGPVNKVTIGLEDVEGESVSVQDDTSISANGLCELKIYDNNLTYTPELRQSVISSASRLFGLYYKPVEMNTTGHPWLIGNELVEITDMEGKKIYTLPFNRTIEYQGHIKSKIESPADTSIQSTYKNTNTLENNIKKTRIIVDKQNQTITSLVENVGTYDSRITTVEQGLDSISQKVENTIDLTREATNTGSITVENCVLGQLLAVKIYGDVVPIFPRTNLYPSTTLYPKPAHYYLMVSYTKDDGSTVETKYSLPFAYLGQVGDTHDEFSIASDGTATLIRRIGIDSSGNEYVLSSETTTTYTDKINIIFGKGTNIIAFNYYVPTIYIKYAIQTELTDAFATKAELSSSITQTKSDITLQVHEDITNATTSENLISQINLTPGKIKLEGTVTANGNFSIDTKGNATMTSATITGGNIYLPSGGIVVGGDGLFTNLQYSTSGSYRGWQLLGFLYSYNKTVADYSDLTLDCDIPENFTVDNAYITLDTSPIDGYDNNNTEVVGKPDLLKLYKNTNVDATFELYYGYGSDYWYGSNLMTLEEIPSAFGSESYSPTNSAAGHVDNKTTINLKPYLTIGARNQFVVRTAVTTPTTVNGAISNTGIGRMTLNIFGHISIKKES